MPTLYSVCKRVYKRVVPAPVRHAAFTALPAPVRNWRGRLLSRLERTARHDEIYDEAYYAQFVEPGMSVSAHRMADSIIAEFAPKSLADVGCGTGGLLLAFKERGVRTVGLEYSKAAIDICRRRGLDVVPFDLESGSRCDVHADVVVSTEVAEHLPSSCADAYVSLLCGIARVVILTAAPPTDHAGTDHVNEQPNEYWIEKFAAAGRTYLRDLSVQWREQWKSSGVSTIYARSLMVFCSPEKRNL